MPNSNGGKGTPGLPGGNHIDPYQRQMEESVLMPSMIYPEVPPREIRESRIGPGFQFDKEDRRRATPLGYLKMKTHLAKAAAITFEVQQTLTRKNSSYETLVNI